MLLWVWGLDLAPRERTEQVKVQAGMEVSGGSLLFPGRQGLSSGLRGESICSGGWGRAVSGQALGTLVP